MSVASIHRTCSNRLGVDVVGHMARYFVAPDGLDWRAGDGRSPTRRVAGHAF